MLDKDTQNTPLGTADFSQAGFGIRLVAQMIDNFFSWGMTVILLGLPILLTDLTLQAVLVSLLMIQEHPLFDIKITYVASIYFLIVIYTWLKFQSTPGKSIMSLRIVDFKTKGTPTKTQFFLRSLGYILATLPFCVGFLWIFINKNKRGWHDIMSRTQVVRIDKDGEHEK